MIRIIKEIDQNMVAGMFDNLKVLKAKIHSSNENGLSSLLQTSEICYILCI